MEPGERLTAFRIHLPLRRPFRSAHGIETVRDVILVRHRNEDGVEGWGECPTLSDPGYTGETTDLAWTALVDGAALGPMASGAIADARLDAWLRMVGHSLSDHLGGELPVVPSSRVIDLDGDVPTGAGAVKVKVTPESLPRLRDVRAARPDGVVAADANGSFRSADEIPEWLDELGLAYLEQPFAPGREEEADALRARTGTSIAWDESVGSIDDLERVARPGDVVNVKPARLGGIEAAVVLADRAGEWGLGAFVGGMLETGIGRAAAVALAGRGGWAFATDLGPSSRYFDEDVCAPIRGNDIAVGVPAGPGIGRTPDPDRLAAVTVATADLPFSG